MLSDEIILLQRRVASGEAVAIGLLAEALIRASDLEREEFVLGGAGENMHMAWMGKGLDPSELDPISEALS